MAGSGAPSPKSYGSLAGTHEKRRFQGRLEEPGRFEHSAEKPRAQLRGRLSVSCHRAYESGRRCRGRSGSDEPATDGPAKSALLLEDGGFAAGPKAHGGCGGNVPPSTQSRSEFLRSDSWNGSGR